MFFCNVGKGRRSNIKWRVGEGRKKKREEAARRERRRPELASIDISQGEKSMLGNFATHKHDFKL